MPQFKCDILSNFQTMCTRVFFFNVQWEFLVLHFVILYNFEYYEKIYRARWIISVTATESCCYTIIGEVWKSHNSSRVSWVKKCCCGFRRCVWRVSWISFVWKKVTSIFNMWHARFSSRYALPCLILLCGFCASINHLQNVIQSVTELTQLICHDKEVVSTALIPNAINNFYTLQTAKGSVAHFSRTLTTWGDWDEKCGNFMTASHYFSVLHSGAAGFCTRKSGFTILNTHTNPVSLISWIFTKTIYF